MHVTETTIRTGKSPRLFVRQCHPTGGPAARTLLLLHGACEHGERYLGFARWMTQRRWSVILPDLRGHGRSGGVRTHVRDFSEYLHDVQTVREHFRLAPQNTALFGHSTGGLIAVRCAQAAPESFASVALSSPLLQLKVSVPLTKVAVGSVMSYIAPQVRFRTSVDPNHSTRNPQAQHVKLHDPLGERSVTAGWYFAMQRAIRHAWRDAGAVTSPLLILQAGQDRIVDPDAPQRWLERTGSADARFHLRTDDYHELLNEPDWEETARYLIDWLAPRVEPAARAAAA